MAYNSSATTDASAKKKSVAVVRIAAGAVFSRMASSNTAVVVDEVKKPVKALVAPSELDFDAEIVASPVAEPVEARRRK